MPRPRKPRCVEQVPGVTYFKPRGIPLNMLEEITLSVEEIEAVRLKDIEDLDGEKAAARMNISRPTFQRILEGARKKIALALVEGKALRIQGGNYQIASRIRRCSQCQCELQPHEESQEDSETVCPKCKQKHM